MYIIYINVLFISNVSKIIFYLVIVFYFTFKIINRYIGIQLHYALNNFKFIMCNDVNIICLH